MELADRFLHMNGMLDPAEKKTERQIKEDKAFAAEQPEYQFVTDERALPHIRELIQMSKDLAHRHRANSVLRRSYSDTAHELSNKNHDITVGKYWLLVYKRMLELIVQEEHHKVSNERFAAY